MIIKTLIEYFKNLANRHKNINCFRTGSIADINDPHMTFPCLYIVTDFASTLSSSNGELDNKWIFMDFKVLILNKSAKPLDNVPVNLIELERVMAMQDQDLDSLHRIIGHVLTKFAEDAKSHAPKDLTSLNRAGIRSIAPTSVKSFKNYYNQNADGWEASISIKVSDPYCCELDKFFEDCWEDQAKQYSN